MQKHFSKEVATMTTINRLLFLIICSLVKFGPVPKVTRQKLAGTDKTVKPDCAIVYADTLIAGPEISS